MYWDTDIPLAAAINSVYLARSELSRLRQPLGKLPPTARPFTKPSPRRLQKHVLRDRPPFRRGLLVDERENVRLGRLGQFNDETDDVHIFSLLCRIRHELVDLLVRRVSLSGEICRDTRAFCLGALDDAIQSMS